MPRIPRRAQAADQAPIPEEQQPGAAPTDVTTTMAPVEPAAAPVDPAPVPEAGPEAAPDAAPEVLVEEATPGFRDRTRMRRRLRYLRRLRELAFRDLGGLAFDLHRFGRERGDLVAQKLEALTAIDGELRVLETALGDRRELHELREPGIAACARCQTLHDPGANFCPGCGTPLHGEPAAQAATEPEAPAAPAAPAAPEPTGSPGPS